MFEGKQCARLHLARNSPRRVHACRERVSHEQRETPDSPSSATLTNCKPAHDEMAHGVRNRFHHLVMRATRIACGCRGRSGRVGVTRSNSVCDPSYLAHSLRPVSEAVDPPVELLQHLHRVAEPWALAHACRMHVRGCVAGGSRCMRRRAEPSREVWEK